MKVSNSPYECAHPLTHPGPCAVLSVSASGANGGHSAHICKVTSRNNVPTGQNLDRGDHPVEPRSKRVPGIVRRAPEGKTSDADVSSDLKVTASQQVAVLVSAHSKHDAIGAALKAGPKSGCFVPSRNARGWSAIDREEIASDGDVSVRQPRKSARRTANSLAHCGPRSCLLSPPRDPVACQPVHGDEVAARHDVAVWGVQKGLNAGAGTSSKCRPRVRVVMPACNTRGGYAAG